MSYLDYINSFPMQTNTPTLETVEFFMRELGNPHKKFKSIYVTGTNGKGSICEKLFAVLDYAGYRVGKFMSPFLIEFNEYIKVGNAVISDEEIEKNLEKIKPLVAKKQKNGVIITYWEIVCTLAFLHFCDKGVDVAIIETGIESAMDCTNVLEPIVTLVSKIDVDHEGLLGNTVQDNMRAVAESLNENSLIITANDMPYAHMSKYYKVNSSLANGYKSTLKGDFQQENTAIVVKCCQLLEQFGLLVTDSQIKAGLKNVIHRARFEVVSEYPQIIFDGCHNANSVNAFFGELKKSYAQDKKILVVSVLKDKNINAIMKEFVNGVADMVDVKIVFTSGTDVVLQGGSSGVFYSSSELLEIYQKLAKAQNLQHKVVEMGFEHAILSVPKNATAFVIGSFKTYKKVLVVVRA